MKKMISDKDVMKLKFVAIAAERRRIARMKVVMEHLVDDVVCFESAIALPASVAA